MKKLLGSHYLLFSLLAIFFLVLIASQLVGRDVLFSLDPWSHNFFARFSEPARLLSNRVAVHNGEMTISYLTSLRTGIYLDSLASGLGTFSITRFAILFLRVLYILMAYALFYTFTRQSKIAFLSVLLLFTSHYFVWRSFITFPENLAILFHLSSIWSLENYRQNRSTSYLVSLGVSLVGVLYAHPPSFYFSLLILAAYAIAFGEAKDWKAIRALAGTGLIVALASLPIWGATLTLLKAVISNNVGQGSSFGSTVIEDVRYQPPTLYSYIGSAGGATIVFAILGFVSALKSDYKKHLPAILLFVFSFGLSLGPLLHVYVPTDRMQAYFFVPVIIMAALFIESYFQHYSGRLEAFILSTLLLVLAVAAIRNSPPWFAYWHGEIEISNELNRVLAHDDRNLVIFTEGTRHVAELLDYPQQVCFVEDTHRFDLSQDATAQLECDHARYLVATGETSLGEAQNVLLLGDFYLVDRGGD